MRYYNARCTNKATQTKFAVKRWSPPACNFVNLHCRTGLRTRLDDNGKILHCADGEKRQRTWMPSRMVFVKIADDTYCLTWDAPHQHVHTGDRGRGWGSWHDLWVNGKSSWGLFGRALHILLIVPFKRTAYIPIDLAIPCYNRRVVNLVL